MTTIRSRARPSSAGRAPHPRPDRSERILAGFVAVAGGVVFAIAAAIDPYDETGQPHTSGTHQQLGLPSCVVRSTLGVPCPSCGMTTSVSLLAHGDPVAACRANSAGLVVGTLGLAATCWLALLASGFARRPLLSAETTILALTVAGVTAVSLRYAVFVALAFLDVAAS